MLVRPGLIFRPCPPSWRRACGRAFQPVPLPFSALGLRPRFAGAFSSAGAASAFGLRPRFAGGFFLRRAFALGLGRLQVLFLLLAFAVLKPSWCSLFRGLLLGGLAGALCRHLEIKHAHGGRVMVMLCSKPWSGFFLERTALLWTVPAPPNASSSLFRISL